MIRTSNAPKKCISIRNCHWGHLRQRKALILSQQGLSSRTLRCGLQEFLILEKFLPHTWQTAQGPSQETLRGQENIQNGSLLVRLFGP